MTTKIARPGLLPLAAAAALTCWVSSSSAATGNAPSPSTSTSTLPEQTVIASRSPQALHEVLADVEVISRAAIERSGMASVAELLSKLSGVTISSNGGPAGTTSVYIRGADQRFTAVLIDGVRVDSQSTGGVTWESIPLSQIERIEILRGPAAAIYGSDAVAGVVQIFTRRGRSGFQPSLRLQAGSFNTYGAQASLRGAGESVDYALTLSGESSDGYNQQPAANPDRDGYEQKSLSASLGWQIQKEHRLEIQAMSQKLEADFDGWMPNLQDQGHHELSTVGAQWSAQWDPQWKSQALISEGSGRYESVPSPYVTRTRVQTALWKLQWAQGPWQVHGDLERRQDRLDNDSTTPNHSQRHQNAVGLGLGWRDSTHAVQWQWRSDRDSEFGRQDTGSLAYGLTLSPQWRWTASAGTAFRAPTLFQRFSIYGSADLKAEESVNLETALRWRDAASHASATLYRNHIDQLIDYVGGPGTCANGQGPWAGCYANVGEVVLSGLSLVGGTQWGAVQLNANVDFMNPKQESTGRQLARRPKEQAKLEALGSWGMWQWSAQWQWTGARFDNVANTRPLPSHSLVNLGTSRPLSRGWDLQLQVKDLLDRAPTFASGYASPGRRWEVSLSWTPTP